MHILLAAVTFLTSAIAQPASSEYQIGPGDVVEVTVHGHDFGRTTFVVGATGEISMPFVGRVNISRQTVFDAESTLEQALSDGYLVDPQITIAVTDYGSQQVEVLGAVAKPGVYFLEGPTTVRAMVAKAGGANGDAGEIIVSRQGEDTRLPASQLEGESGDMLLKAGDVLKFDNVSSVVYLTGEIREPGALPFVNGMTVAQALMKAGGTSELGRLSGAYILRDGEQISVNLKRVLKGKESDLVLRPGDQVVVPESAF